MKQIDIKGMTLISLIITIIIILILSTILVKNVSDFGIISLAFIGAEKYQKNMYEEKDEIEKTGNFLEKEIIQQNRDENTVAQYIKENAGDYYSKTIKGYVGYGAEASSYEWQIYLSDGENVYITTKNYIKASDGSAAIDQMYTNYDGVSDLKNNPIALKWLSYLKSDYSIDNKNINMKMTAYLLDNTIWDTKFKSSQADYAIGAPTIEMLVSSYNATHPDKYIVYKHSENGYLLGWKEDGIENITYYDMVFSTLDQSKLNTLYFIPLSMSSTRYQWIAAPSSYRNNWVYYDQYNGDIVGYGNHFSNFGIRPIVCLNSSINIEKIETETDYYYKIID